MEIETPQTLTFQEEMSWLKKEIKRRGYYRKQPGRMVAERLSFFLVQLLGIGGYWLTDHLSVKVVAVLLLTAGVLGGAAHTHTASHQGLFRSRWLNNLTVFLGYPFQIGLSATHWWNKHIVIHHPNPNIHGVDEDIDFMPYFALTQEDLKKVSGVRRVWYQWQWLIFPASLSLTFANMQLAGWKHLLPVLFDKQHRKPIHWLDLASLVGHYTCFIILPSLFLPVFDVLLFYVIWLLLTGFGAYGLLAPGHFPAEASVFTAEAVEDNVYLQQLATTVNFRAGWLGNWFCCGLNYQIEHHLFPGVSHQFYPAINKLLRPLCQHHGYPHQTLGWGEALWKSYLAIVRPKPVYTDLKAALP